MPRRKETRRPLQWSKVSLNVPVLLLHRANFGVHRGVGELPAGLKAMFYAKEVLATSQLHRVIVRIGPRSRLGG